MRSTQEGKPSFEKAEAAPKSLPGKKTEAEDQCSESSWAKLSFTESTLLENFPERQTWKNQGAAACAGKAWDSKAQALEARARKAQAWEAQACEAQGRFNQLRQTFFEVETAQILKQEHLPEKEEVPEKEKSEIFFTHPLWSNKVEYILAQVGYSMRTFSHWRFSYLWLHDGGWSFLIIYIVMLFLVRVPLLLLEMAAGQRTRQGSIGVWKIISPWIGGVGYTSFMMCFMSSLYLNVVNAWTVTYLGHSFHFPVSWEHCPLLMNSSDFDPECAQTTPAKYFWYRVALKVSDTIEDGGSPVFSLILPYIVSWCLVGAFMINGLKSIGKVMYVLAPVPYFIMLCFLIRCLLLDGAIVGLRHMAAAKISAMYSMNLWRQAGIQVLYALGLSHGATASLSSHIHVSNNCLNDAFFVVFMHLGTMLFSTTFIFCILGFWATVTTHRCSEKNIETLSRLIILGELPPEAQPPSNLLDNPTSIFTFWLNSLPLSIKNMAKERSTFAFLSFLEALSFIPASVPWSILLFLMLLTLGLNLMIGTLQGILTPLQDTFSSFRKHTKLFTVAVFVLIFLCSLFFMRPPGIYYIRLLSEYWVILPTILVVTLENMAVGWAYGARRFLAELTILWDHPIHPIIRWLWCYLCPVVLLVLFATTLFLLPQKTMIYVAWDSSNSKEVLRPFPSWALLLMIVLSFIVILPIPTYLVYCLTHGIPFKSPSLNQSIISSTSLSLMPIKEVQKEETLQGDNQISD